MSGLFRYSLYLLAFVYCFKGHANEASLSYSFLFQGTQRHFNYYIPQNYQAGGGLVFVLHGGWPNPEGDSGSSLDNLNFNELAIQKNAIIIYPSGLHGFWNDGRMYPEEIEPGVGAIQGTEPTVNRYGDSVNDVEFISILIDVFLQLFPIDPNKVFSTGISNGAAMSFRLACSIPDKIKAVAPVAMLMPTRLRDNHCEENPSSSVSVLHIYGSEDAQVTPGGLSDFGGFLDMAESRDYWVQRNRALLDLGSLDLIDNVDDGTRVYKAHYKKPFWRNVGSDYLMFFVEEGGHTWPGGEQYLPEFLVGKVSQEIDATTEIMNFFFP